MDFFSRLEQSTADAQRHVVDAPVFAAVREGRFDRQSYIWFLHQAYHHVKHTVPLMMACGGRLGPEYEWVREALVHYIDDEYGHQEWILNDLEACGVDRQSVINSQPDSNIELMVAWLYDSIQRGNPMSFFGMVHVLEGTSVRVATGTGEIVQKTLGLPPKAFSYLFSHGALDQEHFVFFQNLMNRVTEPADQAAIIHAANMIYRLYGGMLHRIPLLSESREVRHAVA